jgi:hypothetical protein
MNRLRDRGLASFRGRAKTHCIEPGEWPDRTDRPRVLIEHPDGAALWAEAEIMREAGYDVAVCTGPTERFERRRTFGIRLRTFADEEPPGDERPTGCPLLLQGRCSLVDGADVVVSTTDLPQSRGILAALSGSRKRGLVVESSQSVLARGDYEIGDATVVEVPVTEGRLLEAVSGALSTG